MWPELILYRIWRAVRPRTDHPAFFEMQFGVLAIYLYAQTINEAQQRAMDIVTALPFELVGERYRTDEQPQDVSNIEKTGLEIVGVAFRMLQCPTGTEEGNLEEWANRLFPERDQPWEG